MSLQAISAMPARAQHRSSSEGQTQGRHDAAGVERPQVHYGLKERLKSTYL